MEPLEPRCHLSAVINHKRDRDELKVHGTRRYDEIVLSMDADPTRVRIAISGQPDATFALDDIKSIYLRGGRGPDLIRVDDSNGVIPEPIIIWGGAGNDTMIGGAAGETIRADEGDDLVFGNDGWDKLLADGGRDTLHGGDGNDGMESLHRFSLLLGEAGNDRLVSNARSDTLDGGDGDDTLIGRAGNDLLLGGAGNDFLDGRDDNDTLDGGPGNDTLEGDTHADDLLGGDGADIISGGSRSDIFHDSDDPNEWLDYDPAQDVIFAD